MIEREIAGGREQKRPGVLDRSGGAHPQHPQKTFLPEIVAITDGRETRAQPVPQRLLVRLHFVGEPPGGIRPCRQARIFGADVIGGQRHRPR